MEIYDNNGYVNMKSILASGMPFVFVIGGRGTGKTYTTLLQCMKEGRKVLFLRRTQTQLDIVSRKSMSPWKPIAYDEGFEFDMQPLTHGLHEIYTVDDQNQPLQQLGYLAALSTISNLRGFDASDVDTIIFDEFIGENHERPLKREADALLNAYETVNRNRELKGQKPVQLICLANSNRLDADILIKLDLVRRIEKMQRKGQEYSVLPERGICIVLLENSPISQRKAATALYKVTAGTEFAQMALNNAFAYDDTSNVESRNLRDYILRVQYGDFGIYRHKSEPIYYVTKHISGTARVYDANETGMKKFRRDFVGLRFALLNGRVFFETYEGKAVLCDIFL